MPPAFAAAATSSGVPGPPAIGAASTGRSGRKEGGTPSMVTPARPRRKCELARSARRCQPLPVRGELRLPAQLALRLRVGHDHRGVVADAVAAALAARRPRARYLVGKDARRLAALGRLPVPVLDAVRRRMFGLPAPGTLGLVAGPRATGGSPRPPHQ